MAQIMICEHFLPHTFWVKAINTDYHVLNRCLIKLILKKTPYEIRNNEVPNIGYYHVF